MKTRLAARSLKIALLTAALMCLSSVLHGAAPPAKPTAAPAAAEAKPASEVPLILTPTEQLQLENLQLRGQLAQATYQLALTQLGASAEQYQSSTLAAHPGAKYKLSRNGLMWEKIPEPAAAPKPAGAVKP